MDSLGTGYLSPTVHSIELLCMSECDHFLDGYILYVCFLHLLHLPCPLAAQEILASIETHILN